MRRSEEYMRVTIVLSFKLGMGKINCQVFLLKGHKEEIHQTCAWEDEYHPKVYEEHKE